MALRTSDTTMQSTTLDFDPKLLRKMRQSRCDKDAFMSIARRTEFNSDVATVIAEYVYPPPYTYLDIWRCYMIHHEFATMTTPQRQYSPLSQAHVLRLGFFDDSSDAFGSTILFANTSSSELLWQQQEYDDIHSEFVYKLSKSGKMRPAAIWTVTPNADIIVQQTNSDVATYADFIHYTLKSEIKMIRDAGRPRPRRYLLTYYEPSKELNAECKAVSCQQDDDDSDLENERKYGQRRVLEPISGNAHTHSANKKLKRSSDSD